MKSIILTVSFLLCLVGSYAAGYYTSSKGYRVVDQAGGTLIKTNAAQTTKDENQRLGQQVIGKTEREAEELLKAGDRTFFVGKRDGKEIPHTGTKTFTNLTVEVKDGKVVKVIGWF